MEFGEPRREDFETEVETYVLLWYTWEKTEMNGDDGMIAYIKGELEEIREDAVVVSNHGMGYELRVPGTVLAGLPPVGSEVKLYTYLYIREDLLVLYGFLTRDELKVFQLLITVSGIGPKGALAILSKVTTDELRFAVLTDDVKLISSVPGIGAKTAGKLIIELKDKLSVGEDILDGPAVPGAALSDGGAGELKNDVVMALVALGYSNSEAVRAVKQVGSVQGMDSDALLSAALRKISS